MGFRNQVAFKNERAIFLTVRDDGQHIYKRICTNDRLEDEFKYLY